MIGWSGRVDIDGNTYAFLHSGQNNNNGNYANPTVNKLLDQARGMTDLAKRRELYAQMWPILRQELPITYLWNARNIVGMSAKLNGFRAIPDGMIRLPGLELENDRADSRHAHRADHPDPAAGQCAGVRPAAADAGRSRAGDGRRGARRSAGAGADPCRAVARSLAAGAVPALDRQRAARRSRLLVAHPPAGGAACRTEAAGDAAAWPRWRLSSRC